MIYFIQSGECEAVKVGYSHSRDGIAKRLASLQAGNSKELSILGIMLGDKLNEMDTHVEFAPYRIRGGWYKPSDSILAYISKHDTSNTSNGAWIECAKP